MAGEDIITASATVVQAMGAGKSAADDIHHNLYHELHQADWAARPVVGHRAAAGQQDSAVLLP